MKFFIILIILIQISEASLSEKAFRDQVRNFEQVMSEFSMIHIGMPVNVRISWNLDLRPLANGGNGGARFLRTENEVGALIVGGVARDAIMNQAGLDFILCHELGHAMNYGKVIPYERDEDAADKFAIKNCLPFLWKEKNQFINAIVTSMIFLAKQFNFLKPDYYNSIFSNEKINKSKSILSVESKDFLRCRRERLIFWATNKENSFTKTCLDKKFTYSFSE